MLVFFSRKYFIIEDDIKSWLDKYRILISINLMIIFYVLRDRCKKIS